MRPEEQYKTSIIDENREKLSSLYHDIFEGLTNGIQDGFAEGTKRGLKDTLKNYLECDLQLEITDLPNQILNDRISSTARATFEKTIEDLFESLLHHIADEVNKGTIRADSNEIAIINAETEKQQKEALQDSLESLNSPVVKQVAKGIADILNLTWAGKFKDYEEIVKEIQPGLDILSISIKPSPDSLHEKIEENIQDATKEVVAEIVYNIIKYSTRKTVRNFTKEINRSWFRRLKRDPSDLSDSEIEKVADDRQKELLEKVVRGKNGDNYAGQIDKVFGNGLNTSLHNLVVGIKPMVAVLISIAVMILIGAATFSVVFALGGEDGELTGIKANFNSETTHGPEPLEIAFSDLSESIGNISYCSWDFGDGATSTEQNPTHIYTQDGQYTVTLTTTEDDGNYDTKTITNYITVSDTAPVSNFSATRRTGDDPEPLRVSFTDTSTSYDGITSWLWDFGDENSGENVSTEQNPTHIYAQDGQYTITLTITEDDGDYDTKTITSNINSLPEPAPETEVNIVASKTLIKSGETVDLTVTEMNTGDDPLTDVSVTISPGNYTLEYDDDYYREGDTNDNGILDPGETWTWVIPGIGVVDNSTFTAIGHGIDSLGNDITYPEYPNEHDTIDVNTTLVTTNPNTTVSISTSEDTVDAGGTVDLTVTETNTGNVPLSDVSVTESTNITTDEFPVVLDETTAKESKTDDNILEVGEVWTWDASTDSELNDAPINSKTTFTAIGYGVDSLSNAVTWYSERELAKDETLISYEGEYDTVTVDVDIEVVPPDQPDQNQTDPLI